MLSDQSDAHEYKELQADNRVVNHYHASQNVVRAVIANRNEVLSSIFDAAGSYLHSETPAEQIIETAIFEISRRFANLCSLFRSFLDHFDRYFVHNYGKDSAEYIGWKTAQSAEYDGFLSYKIVYTMRNYIQHYDMPPLRMSISDSEREEGFSLSILIDFDELNKDKEIKKKMSTHTDIAPEHLAIINVINEWDASFRRVVSYANSVRIRDALPSAHKLCRLRKDLELDQSGGLSIIWLSKVDQKPDKINLVSRHISEQTAKDIITEDADNSRLL